MSFDPPPLPPGYGEDGPFNPPEGEEPDLEVDSPLVQKASEPELIPPRRSWLPARLVWIFLAAACLGLYLGPLSVELSFQDDRGRIPREFVATLRRGDAEKKVIVDDGDLRVLRWRWTHLEITDLSYIGETHEIQGKHMTIAIERNTSRKLKDAARGSSSIPQRGDPDPRHDR
ncbi:hypothetical protein OJ996_12245 [Luteolibacter sp. GHJ8]|uniref:Uncharacterized protein n=1 Tax=Luteolibacter rhizosphaerae TaxID=2989719 RepID=A0ABT3G3E0_9BACT|nr:hypothetical protein [Luteolibacter rhizosphaerae]MCW1914351.1 hypothetical protein [Luteolibacter rhizosphaerae]